MRRSQKSQKTKKRQRGGFEWFKTLLGFGSSEDKKETTQPASASTNTASAPSTNSNTKHNEYNVGNAMRREMKNGNTTQVVNPTTGGMAPINMKEPMFYPTQRQLDWATTAGLPMKGGCWNWLRKTKRSKKSKRSKRKSRR